MFRPLFASFWLPTCNSLDLRQENGGLVNVFVNFPAGRGPAKPHPIRGLRGWALSINRSMGQPIGVGYGLGRIRVGAAAFHVIFCRHGRRRMPRRNLRLFDVLGLIVQVGENRGAEADGVQVFADAYVLANAP